MDENLKKIQKELEAEYQEFNEIVRKEKEKIINLLNQDK